MNGRPRTTELVGLNHAASVPSMHHAHACLRLTTPSLNLSYPEDAWDHYDEIQRVMQRWLQSAPGFERHGAAGYRGPWIENVWISHFERLAARARSRRRPLHSVFGPFVPLLVPFVDQWVQRGGPSGYRYPVGFVEALLSVVRPSVAYIAVSQNDEGLTGKGELPMRRIPNVLVLSAGGYGHVPVPLLKQTEPRSDAVAMERRPLLVSYKGSLRNAPDRLRERMRDLVVEAAEQHHFLYHVAPSTTGSTQWWHLARWSQGLPPFAERIMSRLSGIESWRELMERSRSSLCPRGYGRSSYRLAETVQQGRVPIYVYSDTPWVPYESRFRRELGYVTTLKRLPTLLRDLARHGNASINELAQREAAAARLRTSHFTLPGVMRQIERFMLAPEKADLECRKLPSSVRGVVGDG